jgi:hypothetical protein
MGVLLVALVVSAAGTAMANVPDLGLSTAVMATTGQTLSLFNRPDGGGKALTEAAVVGGSGTFTSDATITVTLNDGLGSPISNYPFEDISLACDDGSGHAMVPCTGGATADANTDGSGQTHFAAPLYAGGWAAATTEVLIAGNALTSGGVALQMNSADITGDGAVDLSDISKFAQIVNGSYSYGGDFNADGAVNLGDISIFSKAVGGACP